MSQALPPHAALARIFTGVLLMGAAVLLLLFPAMALFGVEEDTKVEVGKELEIKATADNVGAEAEEK